MFSKMKDEYKVAFIRGATTAGGNSVEEIEEVVVELINELISRNNLLKIHYDARFRCLFSCFNC